MERGNRIELSALAWKAKVLPLYEPRDLYIVHKLYLLVNWADYELLNTVWINLTTTTPIRFY